MKKKILGILITFLVLFSVTLLTACNSGGEEPHRHTYSSEWTYDGTHHWHIATCEHTEEISGKAQHDFKEQVINPTCLEQGYTLHTCKDCGYNYKDNYTEIDSNNHTYSTDWTYDETYHWKVATCEHTGEISGKAQHDFKEEVINPTCLEQGYTLHTCKDCGYNYKDNYVDETGHSYSSDWTYDETHHWKVATCEHTEEISEKIGHDFKEEVINPTCLEQGYTLHTCKDCGYNYKDNYVDETGHSYSTEWTYDGTHHWHIATCEHTEEIKDKAQHSFVNGVCNVCGKKESSEGLSYTLINDNTEYEVSGIGICTDIDIIIPSTYNGLPVTSIGNYAFYNCSSLQSIVIPNSVTSIGILAFGYCTSLQSIEIPNSVTSIGNYAFSSCYSLQSIEIPNSVTSIGCSAFEDCSKLVSVVIPNSVTSIDDRAFYGCYKLVEVINLSSLTIEKGGTNYGYLGYYALNVKKSGESEIININDYLFYTYDNVNYLLGYVGNDTELVLPDNYNGESYEIYQYAFYENNKITSITIGNSVTSIGYEAFRNCSSLQSIIIGNSVTSIGGSAFRGCSSLQEITIPFVGNRAVVTSKDTYQFPFGTIFGTSSYVGGTRTHQGYWSSTSGYTSNDFYIPSSLKKVTVLGGYIPYGAFSDCSNIQEIVLGDSVTSIGKYAFEDCSLLTTVIGNSVTSIDDNAFTGCSLQYNEYDNALYLGNNDNKYLVLVRVKNTSITSCVINDNCKFIYGQAFDNCKSLQSIEIPNSITSIGQWAFRNCSKLQYNEYDNGLYLGNSDNKYLVLVKAKNTSITYCTINDNCKFIYNYAFSNCSSLQSVKIENSVTYIGKEAFENCSKLQSVYYTGTIDSWCEIEGLSNLMSYGSSTKQLYINDEPLTNANITKATKINDYAFYNCTSLQSVTIPNSVTSIGYGAFSGCKSLQSIEIPNSVTSIGYSAFERCSSLQSITIGNSVTSIGEWVFSGCSKLLSIEIPNSVTSIGSRAFSGCKSLQSVTIGNSVTSIGNEAFYNCYKLVEVINLSSLNITKGSESYGYVGYYALNVKKSGESDIVNINDYLFYTYDNVNYLLGYIGNDTELTLPTDYNGQNYEIYKYAFYENDKITSVIIPNSVTSIGDYAFSGCSSLQEITIPFVGNRAGVTSSDTYQYPFGYIFGESSYTGGTKTQQHYYGSSLSSTTYDYYYIPTSLKKVTVLGGYIPSGAFENCSNIQEIVLGDSVTSIGGSAFEDCSSLQSIEIPNSVTSIGYDAFYRCSKLQSVTIGNSVTSIGEGAFAGCASLQYNEYDNGLYLGNSDNPYLVLVEAKNTSITSYVINDNCKIIYYSAFFNCSSLTTVTIPNSVTSIGNNAFRYCTSLQSVTIGNSITSIGEYAFYNCSSLTTVTIGNSVTSIGDRAFYNCSSLQSIEIPNSVTSIGNNAFRYCTSLQSVTIGNSVTSIGEGAFCDCSSLTTVTIGNSVTSIGNYAFYGCSKLQSVTIGNSVTSIGDDAFRDCSSLTTVTIGNSVTSIGEEAFYGCSKLVSIEIPNSVTSIGSSAFSGCSKLVSIEIPNSVTSIGSSAFYGCSSLQSVTIGNGVTSIGGSAFYGCSSLQEITIPFVGNRAGVTSSDTYQYPFGYIFGTSSYTGGTGTTQYYYGSSAISTTSSNYYIPTSLKKVTVLGGYIPYGAFYNCANIQEIVLEDSVTSIGDDAFSNCSKLQYNEYDNGLYLGNSDNKYLVLVKAKNTSITSFVINDNCKIIYYSAFERCSSLQSIEIPNSVTSIGNYAFYGCSKLQTVTIGNSVTSIGYEAFYNCSSLQSVTIGNSVTSIGNYAFYGCSDLQSVTFSDSSNWYRTTKSNDWKYKTGGILTDLTTPTTNASYFKSTYYNYYWYKK